MTTPDEIICLTILDDHPIVRRSLEIVTAPIPDMHLVGSFSHSRELFNWLRNNRCDVLILDYILQSDELDGLSLIQQLLAHYPDLRILLSSSMESLAVIRAAFSMGIKGYISKREELDEYCKAVRVIFRGQHYVPEDISAELAQLPMRKRDQYFCQSNTATDFARLSKLLTAREAEVIHSFLEGMSIFDIAAKLKRSRKTVSGHKQSGMKKLGISSDLELFKYREDLFK